MEINPIEIVLAIVNFLILLAVLYKFLYHPLMGMLEKRAETVRNNIETAENVKAEAYQMKVDISAELTNSRQKAQEIIAQAAKAGDDTKAQIVEEAKSEAQKIIAKAQAEINEEKEKALAEIRDEAASLALMAASKLIQRSLNDADHKQLVDKYIQEAGEIQ